jgi:GrpB-like predicted nucleotidyltransferase (UPF0157 family)
VVQIHVCSPGGRQERVHLLFRDYLREHSEVAAAYGRLKQRLAQAYGADRLAYTDAKTDFILSALDDAGGWAERTGWSVPPPRPVAPA